MVEHADLGSSNGHGGGAKKPTAVLIDRFGQTHRIHG
jgi:hypothetical protein